MEYAVECESLSKIYQQGKVTVRALFDVDLKVSSGEFVTLSGPSGSGKTTLLNLLGGLDAPTRGSVRLAGERLESLTKPRLAEMRLKNIGFIFQSYNLIPVLSAQENVEFVLQLQGMGRVRRAEKAEATLAAVGLAGMEKRRPAELSGGQQQRVAIARALASTPRIILADEPTANLDSKTAESLLHLMRALNEERGVTFVISTHDPLVMSYAKRSIQMHDGRVAGDETRP